MPKSELQLIGITSLLLAAKVDEVFVPRANDFALATDGGYTKEQIISMEMKIMQALRWKLFPITLANWANWYMQMWDLYS